MKHSKNKIPFYGYIALILAILVLSGLLQNNESWLGAFDFTNMLGKFGDISSPAGYTTIFRGVGGAGARDAFLFTLTLAPSVMLAFAIIELVSNYRGLLSAERLLTPIMKPLLGLSGASSAIGVVANLTSADAGASTINPLYESGYLDNKQRLIFTVYQFSAPAIIVNYFSIGAALLPLISVSASLCLGVIILMKFVGANLLRLYLKIFVKDLGGNN